MSEQNDLAKVIIRTATKRICVFHPCNDINCNRSPSGCVNQCHDKIAAALVAAFTLYGDKQFATIIEAASAAINA